MPSPSRPDDSPDRTHDSTPRPAFGAGARAASHPFLSAPLQPDELGRLGAYRVLGELGRGGMGAVYRAEDPALRRQVAVKVLSPALAADPQAKARFVREAQAQAQVEHDHIVPIFHVGEADGAAFIVMPLLRGCTLEDRLDENRRPELAEVLRIGREMAEGLAAAHAAGLIHRDIKPSNVWLEDPKGRVKIIDFGLARGLGDAAETVSPGRTRAPGAAPVPHSEANLTVAGAIMGTPAYMSPEQARGKPIDSRTDLWSLGVVLYEMATGQNPFGGPTRQAILYTVTDTDPPPPRELAPDLPEGLSDLVVQLLSKRPADRPPSAAAVAQALAELQAGPRPVVVARPAAVAALSDWEATVTPRADDTVPAPRTTRKKRPKSKGRAAQLAWAGGTVALAIVIFGLILGVRALRTRPDAPGDTPPPAAKGPTPAPANTPARPEPPAPKWPPPKVAPATADPAPIDLLARARAAGPVPGWELTAEGALSDPDATSNYLALGPPPTGDYLITLRFVMRSGGDSVGLVLPVAGAHAHLVFNGFPVLTNRRTGLRYPLGAGFDPNRSTAAHPEYRPGDRHEATVLVRDRPDRVQIAVAVDGKTVLDWSGEPRAVPRPTNGLDGLTRGAVYLSSYKSVYLVETCTAQAAQPAALADPDRDAVRALSARTTIRVRTGSGREVVLAPGESPPTESFKVFDINFSDGPPMPLEYTNGVFLPAVFQLTDLQFIRMRSGQLPMTAENIRQLNACPFASKLWELEAGVVLTPAAVDELKRLPRLAWLRCRLNEADDATLTRLSELPNLRLLIGYDFADNPKITSKGWDAVGRLSIEHLWLENAGPKASESFRAVVAPGTLTALQLLNCPVTDADLQFLAQTKDGIKRLYVFTAPGVTAAGLRHLEGAAWLKVPPAPPGRLEMAVMNLGATPAEWAAFLARCPGVVARPIAWPRPGDGGPRAPAPPADPAPEPKKEPPKDPPPAPAEENDRAAALTLSKLAQLDIRFPNGGTATVRQNGAVPPGPFAVTAIDFIDNPLPPNATDAVFLPAVANMRSLTQVRSTRGNLRMDAAQLRRLAAAPCADRLFVLQAGVLLTPEAVDELKKFPKLTALRVRLRSADDKLVERLGELPALKDLSASDYPPANKLTPKGWAALAALRLRLVWLEDLGPQTGAVFQALTGEVGPAAVAVVNSPITDAHLKALAARPTGVERLQLSMGNQITDAGLMHLAEVKSLKTLLLHKDTKVTANGRQLFQAARPDVTFERELTVDDTRK